MNFKKVFLVSLIILLILSITNIFADDLKLPKPTKEFYVYDETNIIKNNVRSYIINTNEKLFRQTGAQIVVVTVNSLQGETKELYANLLFEKWQIGGKENDNGVLLLVAPNESVVRIEVGYGLEGAITDVRSGIILDDYILPYFENGEYSTGIYNGFKAILSLIEEEYNINIEPNNNYNIPRSKSELQNESVPLNNIKKVLIGIGLLILIIIDFKFFGGFLTYFLLRMISRGGFKGGGSNRGGGGSSGGGGAGRGW